jgi:hypothetical protein
MALTQLPGVTVAEPVFCGAVAVLAVLSGWVPPSVVSAVVSWMASSFEAYSLLVS